MAGLVSAGGDDRAPALSAALDGRRPGQSARRARDVSRRHASIASTAPTRRARSASTCRAAASACTNEDVIDLYNRVQVGAKVMVLPQTSVAARAHQVSATQSYASQPASPRRRHGTGCAARRSPSNSLSSCTGPAIAVRKDGVLRTPMRRADFLRACDRGQSRVNLPLQTGTSTCELQRWRRARSVVISARGLQRRAMMSSSSRARPSRRIAQQRPQDRERARRPSSAEAERHRRPRQVGPVDIVLFAVKLWDTETAAELARPLVGPDTRLITLQNGVDSVERLSAVLGPDTSSAAPPISRP